MNITEMLKQVRIRGGVIELVNERLVLDVPADFPDSLIVELRGSKPAIIELLIRAGRCRNEFTTHESHEGYWECNAESCYCWSTFRYPRICQGVPCRWVWPNGVPG